MTITQRKGNLKMSSKYNTSYDDDKPHGFCMYCKEPIEHNQDYTSVKGKMYHYKPCFLLMQEELEGEDE
jgi:hypothetical protein